MKLTKFTVQACCGKTSVIYKTDKPLSVDLIQQLVNNYSYSEAKHFTKAGILYVENKEFILTGPIGSNKLQVKCKIKDCSDKISSLEDTLSIL